MYFHFLQYWRIFFIFGIQITSFTTDIFLSENKNSIQIIEAHMNLYIPSGRIILNSAIIRRLLTNSLLGSSLQSLVPFGRVYHNGI